MRLALAVLLLISCGASRPVQGADCSGDLTQACNGTPNCGITRCSESLVFDCRASSHVWQLTMVCDAGCLTAEDADNNPLGPICHQP